MLYYNVYISGKNYLDKSFPSLKEAQNYAFDLGFTVCATSCSNGNYRDTLYYVEEGDDLSNYTEGYEPCIIEETGESTPTVLCVDYGWGQASACYISEEYPEIDAEGIDEMYVCRTNGEITWFDLTEICETRGIDETFPEITDADGLRYPYTEEIADFFDRNNIWYIEIDGEFILKRKFWDSIEN